MFAPKQVYHASRDYVRASPHTFRMFSLSRSLAPEDTSELSLIFPETRHTKNAAYLGGFIFLYPYYSLYKQAAFDEVGGRTTGSKFIKHLFIFLYYQSLLLLANWTIKHPSMTDGG